MRLWELINLIEKEISAENAKIHASRISSYHRIQASPGFHEAARYVYDQLVKLGLKPRVYKYVADGKTEYLGWISPVGWEIFDGELWIIEPERVCLGKFRDRPILVIAHSGSTPEEGIEGEVIDVGGGERVEDYRGRDVRGKFVLACGDIFKVHLEAVVKRGAVGILSYDPRRSETPTASIYRGIWPFADEIDKIGVAFSISLKDAERIKQHIREGKKVKVWGRVRSRFFKGEIEVISLLMEGKTKEEVILIAHLCHPMPGSNDNASGSGLLIELARTISELIKKGFSLGKSVRFLWVPEMSGTAAYLHGNPESKQIRFCINLDMVGENQEVCDSVLTLVRSPESLPSYLPYLAGIILDKVFSKGERQFGDVDILPLKRWKKTPYTIGSDHYIFADSTIGVPSIAFIHWPDKFYHTSLDTPDKLDSEELKRVGIAALATALFLSKPENEDLIWISEKIVDECLLEIMKSFEQTLESMMMRDKDKASKAFKEGIIRLNYMKEWKSGVLRSLLEFKNTQVEKAVNRGVRLINSTVDRLIKRIKEIAEEMEIKIPEKSNLEAQAGKICPFRKHKGPISMRKLRKLLSEEEYEQYRLRFKADKSLEVKLTEALNFIDGARSVLDIYYAVVSEYGDFDLRDLMKYFDDLRRKGIIELRRNTNNE